jgi:hypothetical protein
MEQSHAEDRREGDRCEGDRCECDSGDMKRCISKECGRYGRKAHQEPCVKSMSVMRFLWTLSLTRQSMRCRPSRDLM